MKLRDWLQEAEDKKFVVRLRWRDVVASDVMDMLSKDTLDSEIARTIQLNDLYREYGQIGIIAEMADGSRYLRLQPEGSAEPEMPHVELATFVFDDHVTVQVFDCPFAEVLDEAQKAHDTFLAEQKAKDDDNLRELETSQEVAPDTPSVG